MSVQEFSLSEIESRIREYINEPRLQYKLLEDTTAWNQLCSSLDVIGDTSMAINSYQRHEWPEDAGLQYLLVYGLLQALILQQDSVRHLSEVFGLPHQKDPRLEQIRNVRHHAAGHPTKSTGGGLPQHSFFISRISMHKEGFTLLHSCGEPRSNHFEDVSVTELITSQLCILRKVLGDILEKLHQEEEAHRNRFAGESLSALFPDTLGYYFEKVSEAIISGTPAVIGQASLKTIQKVVNEFEDHLRKRDLLPAYEFVGYELEETKYALDELSKYLTKTGDNRLHPKDASIFLFFSRSKLDNLKGMANEIDEQYES